MNSQQISQMIDHLTKAGYSQHEIQEVIDEQIRAEAHRASNPPVIMKNADPYAILPQYQPGPIRWPQEPPVTYDHVKNSLSPVGAIFMRLGMPNGAMYPAGVQHISAHVVQSPGYPLATVEKAFVFVVNDKGEALTLEDPTPSLFPSDGLILSIKMIMESSALKQGNVGMAGANGMGLVGSGPSAPFPKSTTLKSTPGKMGGSLLGAVEAMNKVKNAW